MKKLITIALVTAGLGVYALPAFAMSDLVLTPLCTDSPDTTLNFSVSNANGFSVPFNWDRDSGTETGSGTVATSSTANFSTGSAGSTSPSTVSIVWFDVDALANATSTSVANVSNCPVIPVSVGEVSSGHPGGHHHSISVSPEVTKIQAEIAILQQIYTLQVQLESLQS